MWVCCPCAPLVSLRFFLFVWFCGWLNLAQAHEVGFRELTLEESGERPLSVGWWYPSAENSSASLLGDNAVFIGERVQRNAPVLAGKYPLVILSHGFGGNWRNQNWLAHALVRQGFVVAAPNHPGTTSRDLSTKPLSGLWRRTQDLSRVLDSLLSDSAWALVIDSEHIAAIGHSLGGFTVMLAGGARFDPAQFKKDCLAHAELIACRIDRSLHNVSQGLIKLAAAQRDERIKAVVSLDLGLARGLTKRSLNTMPIPVFVIAAGMPNSQLPAKLESQAMLIELPAKTPYLEISDATHFSFLQACKPGGDALLRDRPSEDQSICKEGGQRARTEIHTQVAEAVINFLQNALNNRFTINAF